MNTQTRNGLPASYQPKAPFEVVGHRGGYMTWMAAVKAGKYAGAAVKDADGVVIYQPRNS